MADFKNNTTNNININNNVIDNSSRVITIENSNGNINGNIAIGNNNNMSFNGIYVNDIDSEQLINALVEDVSKLETATTDIRPYFKKEFDIEKIKKEVELKGIEEVANDLNVFGLYYGVEEEKNYTVMEFKDYLNDYLVDEVKREIAIEKIKSMINDENDIDEELNFYNNQILDKTILEKIIEHLDKYIEKFKGILEIAKLKLEKTSEMSEDKEKINYSDNELYQKYEEWRIQRAEENQDKNNPFIWDCTEESARKDFSEFLGVKETIACDEMLGLEYKYEIGKIVNLSKEDYNLLGIEYPENALKNVDSSFIELSEEQLKVIKDKSMNDLANENRDVFSHLIKEKSLGIFEKDIYEYYGAMDNIENKAINEDIYSLLDKDSISRVIAENLEEKINRRIEILVDLGIDKNFNYDIEINKVDLNDNLNHIFADYLNEGIEIRHKDALDEGQEIKSIKEFEDYAIDYLTPVSLDKNEEEENRKELENEIGKWNYKEFLEFAQDNELNIEKVDRSIEAGKDKKKSRGMSM
ncbi:hypothetical protein [Clostridium perfringens]|uniref:hypothetical protein n=1 Tax=Clostridium perfringens TaxID=1502 RepID=UPI0039ED040F